MFYDGEKIRENEPYEKPAGENIMQRYADRPKEIKKMEELFARKYQDRDNSEEE